jgi:hypothetical protein
MLAEIRWTSRRDLCFTAANARPIDKEEILASGPRSMTECGYLTWEAMQQWGGVGWTVWLDGNPEFSFGFTPQNPFMPHLLSAWAWGSEKSPLCMVEINRWGKPHLVRDFLDPMGCTRIEARSLYENTDAQRWLTWVGFKKECDLPEWGKDNKRFVQYRWLRSEYVLGQHGNVLHKRSYRHVHGGLPAAAATILQPATGSDGSGNRGGTGRGSDDRGTGADAKR